ncbi:MAG: hypothetical protein WCC69_01715 [Pirellulales bacterium]
MLPLGLLIVEAAFLTVAHVAGGPPWTVVAATAFGVLGIGGSRPDGTGWELVWLILPSLGWLAAFWATGNRELFFPFTMYLAAHAALTVSGRGVIAACAAGGLVVAVFLVIRFFQAATPAVLAVEAVAAGVILVATCLVLVRRERSLFGDGLFLALASAAAFVSLQLPS